MRNSKFKSELYRHFNKYFNYNMNWRRLSIVYNTPRQELMKRLIKAGILEKVGSNAALSALINDNDLLNLVTIKVTSNWLLKSTSKKFMGKSIRFVYSRYGIFIWNENFPKENLTLFKHSMIKKHLAAAEPSDNTLGDYYGTEFTI